LQALGIVSLQINNPCCHLLLTIYQLAKIITFTDKAMNIVELVKANHMLAWEAIFLTLGTLEGRILTFFEPQSCPRIAILDSNGDYCGANLQYFIFRRARSKEPL
jgi:hypothetical protein